MDTIIHTFPLPEQEADKLNQVAETSKAQAGPSVTPPQRASKAQSSPWALFGLVGAATLAGLFFVNRRK